jgi:Calcineurin-like phosphoesterase
MPDIRYVVFSDMHLGAENSVLTDLVLGTVDTDTGKAGPVLTRMTECLRDIISKNSGTQKPVLVLNGDLMELALATKNNAAMAFQRFVELVMPLHGERLFDNEFLFLPGNHDHNLWEDTRAAYYNKYLESLSPGQYIKPEKHITQMFEPEKIPCAFLTTLVQYFKHLNDVTVNTCYPAHAILSDNKDKCVVFCHGHYIESMYHLMTTLTSKIFSDVADPKNFEELEMENYAWVDFFWSTLGRSGIVGKDINLIYDKLQDKKAVNKMIMNIARNITNKQQNVVKRFFERQALYIVLQKTLGHMAAAERNEPDIVLSQDAEKGLRRLIEIELLSQLKKELNNKVPADISFIFGHTHKPFVKTTAYEGYKNPLKIYNSGGWVVDTLQEQRLTGGSIILVDENLDVVSLHMYKEGNYKPGFEEAKPNNGEEHTGFFKRLQQDTDFNAEPWLSFSKLAEEGVSMRFTALAKIIKEN